MPRKPAAVPASPSVVVLRPEKLPKPARRLGPDGMALWTKLHTAYDIADEPMVEQVLQVCQAVDLAESTDDPRSQLAARNFVCKVLKNLFAEPERDRPGRPPGTGSW
jgi:hypothetical protein